LYLAPVDFNEDDVAGTGISAAWLRDQLRKCPAKSKILIIDSCFSGQGDEAAAASDIEREFNKLENVVTLASSMKDEVSLVHSDVGQSLFTYWLTQALAGHADTTMDGAITVDEVYAYVHRKVSETAAIRYGMRQTPVASMRFGTEGFPTVVKLKAQSLDAILMDMAEQIVRAVEGQRLKQVVSVPPFLYTSYRDIDDIDAEKRPGSDGSLGVTCAERFYDALALTAGNVNIQTPEQRRRVGRLIKSAQDLGTFKGTQRIANYLNRDFPPVVVYGELLERKPGIVQVRARAIRNDTKATLIETGGTAELNESEWIETNKSIIPRREEYQALLDPETSEYKTRGISLIEQWDPRIDSEPHPLKVKTFPFRFEFLVRPRSNPRIWKSVGCEFIGNQAYVALDRGDEYQIRVKYLALPGQNSDRNVFMKLLVDGLNILDQKALTGASEDEIRTRGIDMVAINPVSLEKSDKWILRPAIKHSWTFEGFYLTDHLVCPLYVTAASESRGLGDQIGLISAVFYEELATRGGEQGTVAGQPREAERPVQRVDAGAIGNPIGSVHIHYVSSQELERLKVSFPK
jgi:hypothetical protein